MVLSVATIALALKLAKKKKPAWALNTKRVIGIGTNAPPELKMTFGGRQIHDVYRTVFIVFNRGAETIHKTDVVEPVTLHFDGANILRPPNILAIGKEANMVSTKHLVQDGDEAIEVGFRYLDHSDGVVVEVFHSEPERIRCSGVIMGAKEIGYLGEFLPRRPPQWLAITYGIITVGSAVLIYAMIRRLPDAVVSIQDRFWLVAPLFLVLLVIFNWARVLSDTPVFYRYHKFPKWAGFLKLPRSDEPRLR